MSKVLKLAEGAEALPSECWELAFNHLNENDLKSVSLVCKDFLATSNLVKKSLKPKNPNLNLFSRHLKRFTQLKEIDVRHFKGDVDEAICEIAGSGLCLETLCFFGKSFKTQSLRKLESNPEMKKSLKHLNCWGTKRLNDNDLVVISNSFPNLEQLDIQNFRPTAGEHIFTNYGIQSLASNLKLLMEIGKAKLQLKLFEIGRCKGFTVPGLCSMLDSKNLHHFGVNDSGILDAGIREFILKGDLANLTCIDITACRVTTSTLFLLSTECCALVDIRIRGLKLSRQEDDNIPISKNHSVQKLEFFRCYDITDELLERVGLMFPSLKVLSLNECSEVTGRGIEAILKSCKYITELNLQKCTKAKMIEEANSELAQVNNLVKLILEDSAIDDEGLAVIATKCPQLVHLNLKGCQEVTTNGIKQIVKNIKTLRSLTVGSAKLNSVEFLEWMLSTGYLASLKKICFPKETFVFVTKGLKEAFMDRGCLMYYFG